MIHQTERAVNQRAVIRRYHPANAPQITACVTYSDPVMGMVARSEGSVSRILRNPPAIAWDSGIITDLERDGIQHIEVYIRDTRTTYSTTTEMMRTHGRYQQRYGLQLVLSLKYWSIDGQAPEAAQPQTPQPEAEQATLFDFAEKGPVYW